MSVWGHHFTKQNQDIRVTSRPSCFWRSMSCRQRVGNQMLSAKNSRLVAPVYNACPNDLCSAKVAMLIVENSDFLTKRMCVNQINTRLSKFEL